MKKEFWFKNFNHNFFKKFTCRMRFYLEQR